MSRGRLALVGAPDFDYCTNYHCAGDCLPHNSKERKAYVAHVLATFDALQHSSNRELLARRSEVRRKARNQF